MKHPDRCIHGHDMTKETNIVWKKDARYTGGYARRCLACIRGWRREQYQREKKK